MPKSNLLQSAGIGEPDSLVWTPEVVSRAIGFMLDDYALSRPSSDRSPGQSGSSRSELSGQGTNVSFFAESGVALSSQRIGLPVQEDVSLAGLALPEPQVFLDKGQVPLAGGASGFADYQAIDVVVL